METVISKELGGTCLIVTLKLPNKTTSNQIIAKKLRIIPSPGEQNLNVSEIHIGWDNLKL